MRTSSVLLLTVAAALAAAGQALLKRGANGRSAWVDFVNLEIASGLLFYALGTMLWIGVLARAPLVKAYAFTALSFVLVYIASVVILKERLTASGAAGVMMILMGLYLIVARGT